MSIEGVRFRAGLTALLLVVIALTYSGTRERRTNYQAAGNLTSITPHAADDFVARIGVGAHLTYVDYKQNSYFSDVFSSVVKPKLRELGIRNIRQYPGEVDTNFATNVARFNELSNPPSGYPKIAFDFLTHIDPSVSSNPQNSCYLPKMKYIINGTVGNCNGLQNYTAASSVLGFSVENPNEPDHCPSWVCGSGTVSTWFANSLSQNPNWPDDVLAAAQAAQSKLGGDAATSNLQLIAPSFVWLPNFQNETYNGVNLKTYLEPLKSYINYGNVHAYCGNTSISTCWTNRVQPYIDYYSPKPVLVTETGHSTAEYSEAQQAKILLRILFDFYERGIPKIYIYELFDEPTASTTKEQNFGLLNEDGREKPAFTWLKNTIALLKDSGKSPQTPLSLNVSGNGIRYSLFQKSDSSYWLALQNDKSGTVDADATTPATVAFASSKVVEYYNPSSTTPYQKDQDVSSVSLNVPDRIVLLKISTPQQASSNSSSSSSSSSNSTSSTTKKGTTTNKNNTTASNQETSQTPAAPTTDQGNQGFLLEGVKLADTIGNDKESFTIFLIGSILTLATLISWLRIRIRKKALGT